LEGVGAGVGAATGVDVADCTGEGEGDGAATGVDG
jgi:hypothetical protein